MPYFTRDTYDPEKRYAGVRLQAGVPIVDADWNELEDIRKHELQSIVHGYIGDRAPRNAPAGFRIEAAGGEPANDFMIRAGLYLAGGQPCRLDANLNYQSQAYSNVTLASAHGVAPVAGLTTPGLPRLDCVYLDVWERLVDSEEDPQLLNPELRIETCVRLKREWAVRVLEGGGDPPAAPPGHRHVMLARLRRPAAEARILPSHIEDRRVRDGFDFELYVRGSAFDSSEGNVTHVIAEGTDRGLPAVRGINAMIIDPGTLEAKATASFDVCLDALLWHDWADWVNANAAPGDVVAVASFDAIQNAPANGAAGNLLLGVGASMAFRAERNSVRSPYALAFLQGRRGCLEASRAYTGPNAHLRTSYGDLLALSRDVHNGGRNAALLTLNTQTLSVDADAGIAGRLAVAGELSVGGMLRAKQGYVYAEPQIFFVGGLAEQYYPMVFTDQAWEAGPLRLDISRANTHEDGPWTGPLQLHLEFHATNWGHGANYWKLEYRQDLHFFVGGFAENLQSNQCVLWLRGNTTYRWRANHPVELSDFSANAVALSGAVYAIKSVVDAGFDDNYVNRCSEPRVLHGDLSVDRGRLNVTMSKPGGGGSGGHMPFTGLEPCTSAGRAQLVLSSHYSDLVIASSAANDWHGSTLSFASYNPANASDYRKFVINQGNWGSRRHMLEFSYDDEHAFANPHLYAETGRVVLALDGITKRLGINMRSPEATLDVNGTALVRGNLHLRGSFAGGGADYLRGQHTLSGGGVISWNWFGDKGRLKWTNRLIAISASRHAESMREGHVNIYMPTTNIPAANVYDGHDRPADAHGVLLTPWDALYVVHNPGGDQSAVTYQIRRYDRDFQPASNWILLAVVNGDDVSVRLGTGIILRNGDEYPTKTRVDQLLVSGVSRFDNTVQMDRGRLNVTTSVPIEGGGGHVPFTGIYPYHVSGRAQVVLSSNYSDLVIASSYHNGEHGSTLTFATYDPENAADYRKFVINQGNWGGRRHMLDFGYTEEANPNPHHYTGDGRTAVTMDGLNKRLGVNIRRPEATLDVAGASIFRNNISLQSPSTADIYALSLYRKDEEDRGHTWNFWHMNSAYGRNSLQIWEYRTDKDGVTCGGNVADGAMCNNRLTIHEGGDVEIFHNVKIHGRLEVKGAEHNRPITGMFRSPNWGTGTGSNDYVTLFESKVYVPFDCVAMLNLSGHFKVTGGWVYVKIAIDGVPAYSGDDWNAIHTYSPTWEPATLSMAVDLPAGGHTFGAMMRVYSNNYGELNAAAINYMLIPK